MSYPSTRRQIGRSEPVEPRDSESLPPSAAPRERGVQRKQSTFGRLSRDSSARGWMDWFRSSGTSRQSLGADSLGPAAPMAALPSESPSSDAGRVQRQEEADRYMQALRPLSTSIKPPPTTTQAASTAPQERESKRFSLWRHSAQPQPQPQPPSPVAGGAVAVNLDPSRASHATDASPKAAKKSPKKAKKSMPPSIITQVRSMSEDVEDDVGIVLSPDQARGIV